MALQRKTQMNPAFNKKVADPKQQQQEEYSEATESPSIFDAIAHTKGFSAPDPGTYEAILANIKENELNAKGKSVQATFVLATFDDEGNLKGQQFVRFFKIFEADGRSESPAIGFLIREMAKLGYSKKEINQESFDEINETQPAISLSIKANANENFPPNANIILRLGEDNENIAALREWIESNPF